MPQGAECGKAAWELASHYFDGAADVVTAADGERGVDLGLLAGGPARGPTHHRRTRGHQTDRCRHHCHC